MASRRHKDLKAAVKQGLKAAVKGGRRNIHKLVAQGENADVQLLAGELERDKGGGVNERDEMGRTPLHVAIEAKQLPIIDLLVVDAQTDLELMDNQGQTPLHTAVKTGRLNIVQRIIAMSKRIAGGKMDFLGSNDRIPLHFAVAGNFPGIVKILLQNGSNPLKQDKQGMTPVGVAALKGFLDILHIMFRWHTEDARHIMLGDLVYTRQELLEVVTGRDDLSLLHLAVQSGNVEVIAYLIHQRINTRARLKDGSTAMHLACKGGILQIVKLLAGNPWLIQAGNFNNITPLHVAARNNHHKVLEYLLSQNANPEDLTLEGLTGLLVASSFGALVAVDVLLYHNVNVEALDEDQCTVLHHAVGNTRVLKHLTEAIDSATLASLINKRDGKGHTALHYAAHTGCASNVNILLVHGASADVLDKRGVSPLALAAANGYLRVVIQLVHHGPRTVNEKDSHGRSPLHICCKRGHVKVAEHLISKRALMFPDYDGRTPLHYVTEGGSWECMKLLLGSFPEGIDMFDCERSTALHMASHYNQPKLITLLLDCGAVILDDKNWQNPLDMAVAKSHDGCALAFIDHERWEEAMKPISRDMKIQLREMVIKMPDVAQAVLDRCITINAENTTNEMVTYNFTYLQGVTSDEEDIPVKHALKTLDAMVSFKQSQCLAHPLCVAFVNVKWKRFGAFISIGNLLSYVIYVLLLSWVVLTYPPHNPMSFLTDEPSIRKAMRHLKLLKIENKTDLPFEEIFKFCYDHPLRWVIVASAFAGLLKELIPVFYQGVTYLKKLSALVEIVVYILTLLSMDPFIVLFDRLEFDPPCPRYYWEIGAMAIFLSWLNLLLYLRRLPRIGLYIVMILSMVQTMLKLLVVVALLVTAFAFAFYMLMSNTEGFFSSSRLSLMKVIVMMVGDLDYSGVLPVPSPNKTVNCTSLCDLLNQLKDLSKDVFTPDVAHARVAEIERIPCYLYTSNKADDSSDCGVGSSGDGGTIPFPVLSYILFIMFALFMMIVVLNVLIGLAVGDIKAVQTDAAMEQLRMQVQLIVELENALPSWFLNRFKLYKVVSYPNRNCKVMQLVSDTLKAVQAPTAEEKDAKQTVANSIVEIRSKQQQLEEWLNTLSNSLDKQMELLKQLAVAVKRAEMNASWQLSEDRNTSSVSRLLLKRWSERARRLSVSHSKIELEMPHAQSPSQQPLSTKEDEDPSGNMDI